VWEHRIKIAFNKIQINSKLLFSIPRIVFILFEDQLAYYYNMILYCIILFYQLKLLMSEKRRFIFISDRRNVYSVGKSLRPI